MGRRGLEEGEHETGCSCPSSPRLTPPEQQLLACCSHSSAALSWRPQEEWGGRMWVPDTAVRRETSPSLPAPPAASSATCRLQHLTSSCCPEEPHAESPLTPRPRASGIRRARLLSPGKHTCRRGRCGWAAAQAPSSPAQWGGSVGKEEEDRSLGPSPPELSAELLGSREGKAPGKRER